MHGEDDKEKTTTSSLAGSPPDIAPATQQTS
jgi:hypothetical protein